MKQNRELIRRSLVCALQARYRELTDKHIRQIDLSYIDDDGQLCLCDYDTNDEIEALNKAIKELAEFDKQTDDEG